MSETDGTPTKRILTTFWLVAGAAGVIATVCFVAGALAANSGSTGGVPSDALPATVSFRVAIGFVALCVLSVTAAIAVGARRRTPHS